MPQTEDELDKASALSAKALTSALGEYLASLERRIGVLEQGKARIPPSASKGTGELASDSSCPSSIYNESKRVLSARSTPTTTPLSPTLPHGPPATTDARHSVHTYPPLDLRQQSHGGKPPKTPTQPPLRGRDAFFATLAAMRAAPNYYTQRKV